METKECILLDNRDIIFNNLIAFIYVDFSISPIVATPFYINHLMN